ncbi:MAG TPA: S8 family serine peptidase [Steroidobacteraceae bacterium]|nr:S8 family serine peptidase [Steroidobacteraceae bacterium]
MDNMGAKILVLIACCAGQAFAQLPIPDVPVQVPDIRPATDELLSNASGLTDATLERLARARELRIGRLAREHRAELDRVGDDLVVRAEVLAIDITPQALQRALARRFRLKRTHELGGLGLRITVLQTPEGWSAKRGLKTLRKLDPAGTYDYNHVYLDGGSPDAQRAAGPLPRAAANPRHARVGLIDAGVDGGHEAFADVKLERFGCDGRIVPSPHGTAVAAILATHAAVGEIDAADVYCGSPTGGASDVVAAALAWLAGKGVAVINVSLVGPRNALLERVVSALVARGFLIVAAVGNDGPAAPPLYPASFAGVIGVTAVDGNHRVLIEACRGAQVDFAARGADMRAAIQAPDQYAPVRGTSFAAPIVAALLATDLAAPDAGVRDQMLARWAQSAHDLGKRGRDDVYGAGELGDSGAAVAGKVNK